MSKDKPRKKKTFMGRLLKGIASVGKAVSPRLAGLINAVEGPEDILPIEHQLAKEGYSENELEFLMAELEKDKVELEEITKRWVSDNESGSWLAKNVRPFTLILYNVAVIVFIYMDSYTSLDFEVKAQWMNLLLSNTGIVNTAYFGSRYLEKRDKKKYS
jgi:hypothetical protein